MGKLFLIFSRSVQFHSLADSRLLFLITGHPWLKGLVVKKSWPFFIPFYRLKLVFLDCVREGLIFWGFCVCDHRILKTRKKCRMWNRRAGTAVVVAVSRRWQLPLFWTIWPGRTRHRSKQGQSSYILVQFHCWWYKPKFKMIFISYQFRKWN